MIALFSTAQQTYNPTKGTASNKPYAPSQGVPTDSRTYFYDSINFLWRPYATTSEVKSYLNLPKYRVGQFDVVVNTGGTLSSGVITGGSNAIWYFKNGTADSNLVLKSAIADTTNFTYLTYFGGDGRYFTLQPQAPTSTLSGGYAYERSTGSTIGTSVGWGAGRLAGGTNLRQTSPIASIVVNGVTQTFSQPTAGASVSGSQSVTIPVNTNVTISNIVTTTTGESATSYTFFTYYDKRYVGWSNTATPTDAEIRAAINQDNNGGTVGYSTTLAQLGTSKYLFYANTSAINGVSVNGFPSSDAFNLNVSRSFTNAVGGTTTYFVTTSKNAIGATSATSLTIN